MVSDFIAVGGGVIGVNIANGFRWTCRGASVTFPEKEVEYGTFAGVVAIAASRARVLLFLG